MHKAINAIGGIMLTNIHIKPSEITDDFLRDFSKTILEKAKMNLEKDKHLVSMVFFIGKSQVHLLPTPFTTERDKLITEALISKVVKQLRPDAVIFLSDGWSVSVPNTSDLKNIRPSKHPERKECITLSIVTKAHKSMAWIQFYSRENDDIKFGELTETNENSCRFIDDAFTEHLSKEVH